MKLKLAIAVALLCSSAVPRIALGSDLKSLGMADFAYGRTIETEPGAAAYRLALPEDVYRGLARDDLGDIRVFNANGEIVPHEISRAKTTTRTVVSNEPLPIFRIQGTESDTASSRVTVSEDAAGKVVSVTFEGAEKATDGPAIYLLDARKIENPLHALDFEWSAPQGNQVVPLTVWSSDNLSDWKPIGSGVLARLSYDREMIEQKRLEIPVVRYKFLKVVTPAKAEVVLTKAVGSFSTGEKLSPVRLWTRIIGAVEPNQPARYGFVSPGPLPVSALQIPLPEENTLIRVAVSSKRKAVEPWITRFNGVIYRLQINSQHLVSPEQELPAAVGDRVWSVEIIGSDARIGSGAPQLLLGWVPHDLTFVARGSGPFKLAYGNPAVKQADFGVSSLGGFVDAPSGQGLMPGEARLGAVIELGGAAKLRTPEPPVPWRQWALWTTLGVFLAGLGYMTWKLGVTLKNSKE